MVLVFYKVVALVLKVFSKPLIQHTKKVHLSGNASIKNPRTRQKFVQLGNTYNYYEQLINRKFLQIESQFAYKPLNQQLAIEKGINFLYELLFYIVIISIPLYEMNRSQKQSKQKSKKLQQQINNLQTRFGHLLNQIELQKRKIQEKRVIEHSLPSFDGREAHPLYKLCLRFPDKKTHIYNIAFLI